MIEYVECPWCDRIYDFSSGVSYTLNGKQITVCPSCEETQEYISSRIDQEHWT